MTDPRSRRWFQLSLKSLFLLTLLVATFFAGYTLRVKQEAAERERAKQEALARLKVEADRHTLESIIDFIGSRQPPVGPDTDGPPPIPPNSAP